MVREGRVDAHGTASDVLALSAEERRRARRYAWFYTAAAAALLPWIVYLAVTLPRRNTDLHYRAAWVGFDALLVVVLARTAYMAFRVDLRITFSATVTATLLFVDAWFDITTSGSRSQLLEALVLAACVEIPAALFTLSLAHRVGRRVLARAAQDLTATAEEGGAPTPQADRPTS